MNKQVGVDVRLAARPGHLTWSHHVPEKKWEPAVELYDDSVVFQVLLKVICYFSLEFF